MKKTAWTTEDAAELYGIKHWGDGYFSVSDSGEILIHPDGKASKQSVSLMEIISGLSERGLEAPVLLRIENILASRIQRLHEAFAQAIEQAKYQGVYRGVYPIKVNQQEQVVSAISQYGEPFHHGLEAGSKAELIAAVGCMTDTEAYLICNGYKDAEFIDLALYARKLGLQCILVIESPGELQTILERAEAIGVRPILGVRMKLATQASGRWAESGGDQSVFGLSSSQVIDLVDELRGKKMLDCLELLHYHVGSQIPNIRDIRVAVSEAARIYGGLVEEGAAMGLLDLGGGLAVDYDGSKSNSSCSRNYSMMEYAADVVESIMDVLNDTNIPHPTIVTESGRSTVAYYSILLFNILDVSRFESHEPPVELPAERPDILESLFSIPQMLGDKNAQECFHDAMYYLDEARQQFKHGVITLRERALSEQLFRHCLGRIIDITEKSDHLPDELSSVKDRIADIYYGNFSVFQSLPDAWAIDQLFPIMPIHRLDQKPDRRGIIADITCDCDGRINQFISSTGPQNTLPLHSLEEKQEYYLGAFLVGAYQETLGDLHNLLGDTNVVSIRIEEDGHLNYEREIGGDSVADVLSYVEYDTKQLAARIRRLAEQAVRKKLMSPRERRGVVEAYDAGLRGYTYFER